MILLFISVFYFFITSSKNPFLIQSQNYLENWSNFCSCLIVLVGNFYITDISDNIKDLLLILIVFFTSFFLLIWLASTFNIFFGNHENFFRKSFLNFYLFYRATRSAFSSAIFHGNFTFSFKQIKTNFAFEKEQLKCQSLTKSEKSNVKKAKSKKKIFQKVFEFFNEI